MGVPENGWFIMGKTNEMDDLGYPYFRKPPYTSIAIAKNDRVAEIPSWLNPHIQSYSHHTPITLFVLPPSLTNPKNSCPPHK